MIPTPEPDEALVTTPSLLPYIGKHRRKDPEHGNPDPNYIGKHRREEPENVKHD